MKKEQFVEIQFKKINKMAVQTSSFCIFFSLIFPLSEAPVVLVVKRNYYPKLLGLELNLSTKMIMVNITNIFLLLLFHFLVKKYLIFSSSLCQSPVP